MTEYLKKWLIAIVFISIMLVAVVGPGLFAYFGR